MVVPDEVIKIFMFLTVFVVALNFFVNGFARVHEDVEEISSYEPMSEISECDFSENSFNRQLWKFPDIYTPDDRSWFGLWDDISNIDETVWVNSGTYHELNIKTDSRMVTGQDELYLADGEESGIYTLDFNLWPEEDIADYEGTILNTIDSYADVGPNQTIIYDVRVLSGQQEPYTLEYQKDYIVDDPDKTNEVLDLNGYEIGPEDKWLRVSITIDESQNSQYQAEVNEFSVYGEKTETYDVRDYISCSVVSIQSWGKSLFLDTGIPIIDGIFNVLGVMMYLVSVLISAVFLTIGIIISVLMALG